MLSVPPARMFNLVFQRGTVALRFKDGTSADLYCVDPAHFAVALWRATGSAEHCADALVGAPHLTMVGDELRDESGRPLSLTGEGAVFGALGHRLPSPWSAQQ